MAEPFNVVIDISHHNANPDFQQAAAAGIVGVIHKATQGTTFKDSAYETNRQKAIAAGLLWGAYHFGVGGNGAGQADFFLQTVKPGPDTLLVLDYEPNTQGATMSLDDARAFVNQVNTQIGRFPGLYSGSLIKEKLGNNTDPILSQCFFWLAQYGSNAVVPPNWPTWTLWQYTDGNLGPQPHSVPGIGNCDRDKFNGDLAGLKRLWGVTT
ncbi:MAG TPA: glycoside hydrolase family 25 protein [Blastocatellia bacterium]|nr:glycoside hydrolase family 25 protein [Blastocatellia bacterium]